MKARQQSRPCLEQRDRRTRSDVLELAANLALQFAHRTGELDACRAAADDHYVEALDRQHFVFDVFVRAQQRTADLSRVGHRLHLQGVLGHARNAECRAFRPDREHEIVVRQRLAGGERERLGRRVDTGHRGAHETHLAIRSAHRECDVVLGQ